MAVTKITVYRVEVEIPDRVWTLFHDSQDYQQGSCRATQGNLRAGCDHYSNAYEWAEFATAEQAVRCERRLVALVQQFTELANERDSQP